MTLDTRRIRADFPPLNPRSGRPPVYLDSACMSLRPRQVIEASNRYYEEFPACHGRTFHAFGRRTTREVDAARTRIRKAIGAAEDAELIFLKNVTEGLNLLATSLALGAGDTVITTGMEHNSNLLPWQREARRRGFTHLVVPLTSEGELDRDAFERALDSARIRLVCTFHTSNVTGVTLPVEWIVDQAHRRGALVAFDGAQAMPHRGVDVRALGCDFYVFSFYKMLGPSGIAALYGRRALLEQIPPPLVGGEGIFDTTYVGYTPADLPDRLEPGLQNYAGILGAAAAVAYLEDVGHERIRAHDLALNRRLTAGLEDVPGLSILGPRDPGDRGSVVNFRIDGLDPMEVAHVLDTSHGIMLRAGKHCAHAWFHANQVGDTLRASVYLYNTQEEMDLLARVIRHVAREFV